MNRTFRFTSLIACLLTASALLGACNRRDGQTSGDMSPASAPDGTAGTMGTTPGTTGTDGGLGTTPGSNSTTGTPGSGSDGVPQTGTGTGTGTGVDGGTGTTAPGAAPGASTVTPGASSQAPLNAQDQAFARAATEAGLYEVAVAQLAVEKAEHPDVKAMAATLVDDHGAANNRLAQVVSTRMTLPKDIPSSKRKVIDQLNKAEGLSFDRQFIDQVGIKDHQLDIDLFQKADGQLSDSAMKEFVQTTLPTLRHHLSMAQDLARKLKQT